MTTLLGTYGGRAKPGSAIAPTAAQTRTDSRQEAEQLVANKTGTCFTLSSRVPARGECMKCGLECRASDERVWSIISPRAAWAPQLYLPAILMLNLILSASSPLSPSRAPPPHTHTTAPPPSSPPPIITILYCNYSSLFNYLDRRLECSHCRRVFRGKRELTWLAQQRGGFLIRHFSGNFRRALTAGWPTN